MELGTVKGFEGLLLFGILFNFCDAGLIFQVSSKVDESS